MLVVSLLLWLLAHLINTILAEAHYDVGTFLKEKLKRSIHMPVIFNIRLILLTILLFFYQLSS